MLLSMYLKGIVTTETVFFEFHYKMFLNINVFNIYFLGFFYTYTVFDIFFPCLLIKGSLGHRQLFSHVC